MSVPDERQKEFKAPRGTRDILPAEIEPWRELERVCRSVMEAAGYLEIRTPIFEHTELFQRGIGETTDIVEKEMYTFLDRAGRSITLRPEGTASVVRSYLEHKMYALPQPIKVYYIGRMYRYERPQAGRYREFRQFGAEAIGAQDPAIDAELIEVFVEILSRMGLKDLEVHVNSIGCPECRPKYRDAIREGLEPVMGRLCEDCLRRLTRNPLRILDCKNPECRDLTKNVANIFDHLCDECRDHFQSFSRFLDISGIQYVVDPRIVRGLDYYTKTVFEVISRDLGAQDAVGGGGRYDGLVEECGGSPTPGAGFAAGMDRIIQLMTARKAPDEGISGLDVFIAALGDDARLIAFKTATDLRRAGVSADIDHMGRSLRAQMKFADRGKFRYVVILGEDEIAANEATIREMATGAQTRVSFDGLVGALIGRCLRS